MRLAHFTTDRLTVAGAMITLSMQWGQVHLLILLQMMQTEIGRLKNVAAGFQLLVFSLQRQGFSMVAGKLMHGVDITAVDT